MQCLDVVPRHVTVMLNINSLACEGNKVGREKLASYYDGEDSCRFFKDFQRSHRVCE